MTMDSFERLSAWLDGALDPEDAAALEAELATNPALAEQLAQMQATDASLRAAFDAPMHEPVPDRFTALLGDPPTAEVIDFAAAKARRQAAKPAAPRRNWQAYAALAATVVFGFFFLGQPGLGPRPDAAQVAFNKALETAPSGQQVALGGGKSLTPRLSFAAKDGRYCREFASGDQAGLACRGASGWTVEAMAKDDGPKAGGEEGGYATAGGGGAALDQAYAKLGAGDPMDTAREQALIANGWKAGR